MEVQDVIRCYIESCNGSGMDYDEISRLFASKTHNSTLQAFLKENCPTCYNDHDRRSKSSNVEQVFAYLGDQRTKLRNLVTDFTSFDMNPADKSVAFLFMFVMVMLLSGTGSYQPENEFTAENTRASADRAIQHIAKLKLDHEEWLNNMQRQSRLDDQEWLRRSQLDSEERLRRIEDKHVEEMDRHDHNWVTGSVTQTSTESNRHGSEYYGGTRLQNNDYQTTIKSSTVDTDSTIDVLNDCGGVITQVTSAWFDIVDKDIADMTTAFGLSIGHVGDMPEGTLGQADLENRHIRLNMETLSELYTGTPQLQLAIVHEIHHMMSSHVTAMLKTFNNDLLSLLINYFVHIDNTEALAFVDRDTTASALLNGFLFHRVQSFLSERRFYMWLKNRISSTSRKQPLFILLATHLNLRSKRLYERLPIDNPYKHVYQGTNYQEYFAVAAEQYLGVKSRVRLDENGTSIGREWIRLHDPGMFQLLQDIYGDRDLFDKKIGKKPGFYV